MYNSTWHCERGGGVGGRDEKTRVTRAGTGGLMAPAVLRHVDGVELGRLVGYADAISALERAFARVTPDGNPARSHLVVEGGELLLMPAHGAEGVGVKLVTLCPDNGARGLPLIHGVYVLFAPSTLEPEALIEGAALTALRTASLSALATRYLARPDAHRLVVFGAGAQAVAHVEAMCAVRPIKNVRVVGTGSPRTLELVARIRERGLDAELGVPADAARADIICTCTTSPTPLFADVALAPGTHVNAVGAYRANTRELTGAQMERAIVVVETRSAALAEAGDVVLAIDEGRLAVDDLFELADIVQGRAGRETADQVTIFKSVGLAVEDLAIARAAVARLDELAPTARLAPPE